jgi:putative DNA primase/helicase
MTITPRHYAMLHEERAIAEPIITGRGYLSLPDPGDIREIGFSKAQGNAAPALGIPRWDVHGQRHGWQIRPDAPRQFKDGSVARYENAKGDHLILDVHPSVQPLLGNPAVPLWITEGIPKGDSLVSKGCCTIALAGVDGFRGKNEHGGKVILPDWDYVALNDRLVYVVYDSDIYQKPNVEAALKALYQFLRSRHARPGLVQWPEPYRQGKTGVDDYFAQGGTIEDLLAMVPPMGPLPPRFFRRRNGATPDTPLPPPSAEERALPLSDYTNALRFVREHGQHLRYCYPWNTWLVWQGTHWQRDTSGEVMRRAKQTVTRLARDIEHLSDDKAIDALMTHIKSSLSTAKLEALVKNAQSEPGMQVQPEDLDQHPWLLNCTNGTLDLTTGELKPHLQADMLTKCLPTPYDSEATCPTWETFLWRIMGGSQGEDDPDTMSALEVENRQMADERARALIAYLQRTAGYTLTGSTREQCMFLCHGPTKTGKSTYLATLRRLLGAYGKQTDMQTFMHKDRPEVRNDLADLAGARYVYAVESQEGKRLAEGLVKQMTGGVDGMKARFLYEELFEFKPQFKAYLGTNHLPIIKDSDDAIWERIRRIPFIVQIPKADRNKALEETLAGELPGILAWAVRGCLAWRDLNDLQEPDQVVDATNEYRCEMDDIGRFLAEVCIVGDTETYKTQAQTLLKAYQIWGGNATLSGKAFAKLLTEKGYESKRFTSGMFWLGIGLPAPDDSRQDK